MKYPYIVNKNGVWYPAGTDVPEDTFSISEKEPITEEKKSYKKSDIFRMPTAELQALAESEGIENATELTGSELKTILVKHFNL